MENIVVYNDGELELKVSFSDDTIWLTQKQLGELFKVELHNINYHIKNIFKQKELDEHPTIRKTRIVRKEDNREVQRDIKTIFKHINNIFKDKELDKIAVVAKFATTAKNETNTMVSQSVIPSKQLLGGAKPFAFSKLKIDIFDILSKLKK